MIPEPTTEEVLASLTQQTQQHTAQHMLDLMHHTN